MIGINYTRRLSNIMASNESASRGFSKRYGHVTTEDIEKILLQNYYVVLKCDIETDKPLYPYRESEIREYRWKGSLPKRFEFPARDEGQLKYPTGRFTAWLRTKEVKEALVNKHILKCYEVLISSVDAAHRRKWGKLTKEVFKIHGETCMRCGESAGQIHVDHIVPWAENPMLRYDIDNLQVLCRTCHTWKTKQKKYLDFRKKSLKQD